MNKIKTCPFCGSNETYASKDISYETWTVCCHDCKAEGPVCYDRKKAIEKWNSRETGD